MSCVHLVSFNYLDCPLQLRTCMFIFFKEKNCLGARNPTEFLSRRNFIFSLEDCMKTTSRSNFLVLQSFYHVITTVGLVLCYEGTNFDLVLELMVKFV